MKRTILVAVFLPLFLASCNLVKLQLQPSIADSSTYQDDLHAVYAIYVERVTANGEVPLAFEDWLSLIKGDQGDKGDKGDKGESAYELYIKQFPGYVWGEENWVRDLALGKLSVLISFDSMGGNDIEPLVFCKGEEVNIALQAEKEHGSFLGWFKEPELNNEIDYSFIAEESMTCFASYSYDAATVTFVSNGAIYDIVETNYYSMVEPIEDPAAKLGFRFIGWKLEGEEAYWDFSTPVMESEIRLVADFGYDFAEIPAVIIDVDGGLDITSKNEYSHSNVSILNTEDTWQMYDVPANVRGRGNTTWTFPKKPYRIKFDKKQSILGSTYKAKSWTLLANYADKSLSRNFIADELSSGMDGLSFTSAHHFVDVYLNGEYKGVYLLCDQMQTGEGRIEVDETLYEDGDSGFFFELDQRASSEGELNVDYFVVDGVSYGLKTPDTDDETYLQSPDTYINYITNYLTETLEILNDPTSDYSQITAKLDPNSFADAYIIDELMGNNDVGFSSSYFWKDRGGVLFKGPVWDFDTAGGNCNYGIGVSTHCPPDIHLWARNNNQWYNLLTRRPEFLELLKTRISQYETIISSALSFLDSSSQNYLYGRYQRALDRNFDLWDIMGVEVWPEPESVYAITTVPGQMSYLRNWLLSRWNFIKNSYGVNIGEPEIDAFSARFLTDANVDHIEVYETSNYDEATHYPSVEAYSRDSASGAYLNDGNGQINFEVFLKEGYVIDAIEISGSYKNLKGPTDTLRENPYRITKVSSDLNVSITTKALE